MLKKPKVTFMTTLGVNVGDEFIREGIGSFLDEIFDNWTPFYVNKHKLATLHERVGDEKYLLKDKFYDADIIIQAGAPVYWKLGESASYNVEWAEELWRKRIFKLGPSKPILNIAAGACQPYPDTAETFIADPACVKFAEEVSAACRWTSVRDPLASQILQALNLEHDVLPCTAFHAARRIKSAYALNGRLGINLMPLGGHYKFKDDIDSKLWSGTIEKFLPDLRKRHRLLFIAHDLKEKEFMGHYIAEGETIFHSADYHAYMGIYAQCAAVVANRVHGAVCAAGFGRPSVIIGNDTRLQIGDYLGIPARYVGTVSSEEIIDLLEMGLAGSKNEKDRLLTLREDSAARYRTAIIENIYAKGGNSYSSKIHGRAGNEFSIPEDITKILVPRFDTIGDIVLLEGFIEALIEKFPQAEIVLLVREGYDQLAPLFPEKLRWMTTSINPYKNVDEKCLEKLTELSGEIAGISCGLLLTTTYNRTWLDDVVAAMVPDALRIALGEEEETGRARGFLKILGTEVQRLYNKIVPVDEHLHETEKYQILWEALFKDGRKLSLPRLNIAKEIENRALTILADAGLEDKKFFVCIPAGNQNIPAKVWPAEYFAEAVFWITRESGLRPLIVCHESETAIVSALSEKLEEKGVGFHTWIGKDGELPILAGLMKKACFYLGNDTGPMHIAAASGIPVAGIFGGGTWPRFLPLGPHSIGLAGELPCFGCYWDCIFGDAPCIRLVTVYDVQKAIRLILKEGRVETNMMYASKNISKETMEYIEKTAAIFKMFKAGSAARLHESAANSAARLEAIHERDRKLQESEANSAARLEAIHERDRKLHESEANSAARLEAILERDRKLQESEVNSAARLEAIHERDRKLQESEANSAARLEAILERDRKLQESGEQIQQLLKATALLPLVSVVTPVFNGERWIESCIKSVMQQDYPRIEHIIIDGGSSDGTIDICRKYPDLILHSKKDRGQSHAINKGFAMARGEILAWLCADDEYEAGAVEAAVKGILSGHKVVMGYSRFIDAEGNLISEHPANAFPYYNHDMFLRFWQYNPVSQPAIFWTRGMWETCGPLRETLYFAMDYDLWLRMSLKTRFERVDAYLAKYRIHADAKCFADNYGSRIELINVSRQYWPSIWKTDYWRLLLNYKTSAGPITQHYADAEKLLNSAAACLNNGKRFSAVTAFVRAHLRHFAAPQMPGYPLIFKRILGEGIGPLWLWSLMKRVYYRMNLK